MKYSRPFLPAASLLLSLAAFLPAAFSATPILEYKFNDSLASTGSVTTAITLQNSATRGLSGGSSRSVGDGVLDLSAASGMSSTITPIANAPAGLISTRPAEVNLLTSFTIQGWFKTDGSIIGGNANLMTLNGPITLSSQEATAGRLTLSVDGTTATHSTNAFNAVSTWTFFAVTYDGTVASANVKFYVGNTSTAVSLVGSALTLNAGTVGNATSTLVFGNSNGLNRGVDGLLDNLRVFGDTTGALVSESATGVLSLSDLEALRVSDITAIPEPSTYAAILAGFSGLAVCIRRRSRADVRL